MSAKVGEQNMHKCTRQLEQQPRSKKETRDMTRCELFQKLCRKLLQFSLRLHELAVVCKEQQNLTAAAFFVGQSKRVNVSKDYGYCWCMDIEGIYCTECSL